MLKVSESWLELPDGDQLYTKSWTCQSPIATVLFIHGFGEHCSRYQHIFQMFSKDGISVFSYDQRGFGKTGIANNNLGYTGGMDLVLSDIKDAISRAKVPNKKLFLMGQSMGAGLVLRYATENDDFDGIIACSPAINFGKIGPISFLTKYAAYFMSYFIPQYTLASKIGAFYISRDKAVVEACEKDPLCTSSISLLTASDLIRNSNFLLNEDSAKLLSKPLLITHGSGDMITCHDSSEMFYNECIVEDKAFVSYNGWFHELHNEPDYMTVIQGYIDWIKNRV